MPMMEPYDPQRIAQRVRRAVTAAGANPWLVGYDANGIQELIAASGRPISMRGASEAIGGFDAEVVADELAIFAGGGRGVVLARSAEHAAQRARTLVDRYRVITHGGAVAACQVPLLRGGDAEAQSIRWLRHRIDVAKDAALPPAGALPDDRAGECAYCRRYRGICPRKRDERIEQVCVQCNAMLEAGRSIGKKRGARRGEMSRSIEDIATDGWIGVISADGNNLGSMFESLTTLVELAVVSEAVAASFQRAQDRALAEVPEDKRVPLMTGGDDVRAFLPPGAVLDYVATLVAVVEATATEHARSASTVISPAIAEHLGRLGVGVGAVIANVYYPAWRLVEYAHKLEDSAKAACRKHEWRSGFDFTVITSEDAMTTRPVRTLDKHDVLPLSPGARSWHSALRQVRALADVPQAQIAGIIAGPPDPDELGNLLRYQVARSKEWQAWYEECGIDWRNRDDIFARRPTQDHLALARLLAYGRTSR